MSLQDKRVSRRNVLWASLAAAGGTAVAASAALAQADHSAHGAQGTGPAPPPTGATHNI